MNSDDLERVVSDCHAALQYLLGNPHFPNADGAIVKIEEHFAKLNGTVADILLKQQQAENELKAINEKQEKVLTRVLSAMPLIIKITLITWFGISLVVMGLGLEKLT